MVATSAPFGFRPVYHPSGIIRQETLPNGIASAYATAIYTHTPVKFNTDGTIGVCTSATTESLIGVFQGCEFSSSGKFFVLPYWPAAQTYDNDGTMQAYYTSDPNIIYEVQSAGAVPAADVGESVGIQQSSTGSTFTGYSTQTCTTGQGASSGEPFQIVNIAPYVGNTAGDAFTIVRVKINSYQGSVA